MEFFILAFEALKERKVRSIFTIIMVLVGVTLIVAVDSLGAGTKKYVKGEFAKFNTRLVVVSPSNRHPEITEKDIKQIEEMEGVVEAVPYWSFAGRVKSGGKEKDSTIIAVDNQKLTVFFPGLEMEDGELLTESDTTGAVLGYYIAHEPDGSIFAYTGDVVEVTFIDYTGNGQTIKTKNLVVRGVLKTMGATTGFIFDQMVIVSKRLAKQLFNKDTYNGVFILAENSDMAVNVSQRIMQELDLNTISPQEIKEIVDNVLGTITLYTLAISTISLLVAAVGIITTLYTSMLERIREIGVLKAIGFKSIHILKMFLYEALLIGIIGSVLGSIFGVVGAILLRDIFFADMPFIEPIFSVDVFLRANLMAISLSIMAGLYPAWRASRLDPIVALRHE